MSLKITYSLRLENKLCYIEIYVINEVLSVPFFCHFTLSRDGCVDYEPCRRGHFSISTAPWSVFACLCACACACFLRAPVVLVVYQLCATQQQVVELKEDRCESCYGAETPGLTCCNNCDDVREAYRRKGWAFVDPQTIEQVRAIGGIPIMATYTYPERIHSLLPSSFTSPFPLSPPSPTHSHTLA